jgi:hypothetical protein
MNTTYWFLSVCFYAEMSMLWAHAAAAGLPHMMHTLLLRAYLI